MQTIRVAHGPYSEHIRSVHLIMTSGHSVLSVRTIRTNRNGPYAWLIRTVLIPRYISYISHKAKQARSNSNIPRSISHKPQNLKSLSSVWLKLVKGIILRVIFTILSHLGDVHTPVTFRHPEKVSYPYRLYITGKTRLLRTKIIFCTGHSPHCWCNWQISTWPLCSSVIIHHHSPSLR